MSKAEDEDDVVAAKAARDEQVAERAEYDECFVPYVSTSGQFSIYIYKGKIDHATKSKKTMSLMT